MSDLSEEEQMRLAIALSISDRLAEKARLESAERALEQQSNQSPDPETLKVLEKIKHEDMKYMQGYGLTCIIDPGASYSLSVPTVPTPTVPTVPTTHFTNKCAILSVWTALTIQAALGLCSVKTPFVGERKFTNPHELYLHFVRMLSKCSQFPGEVYDRNGRFSRDWFGLIANTIGQNVYIWDIESRSCLKFYPRDSTGVEFNGVDAPDLETIDPTRRIILVHVPGHIMVVAATFVVFGVTCTYASGSASTYGSSIDGIGSAHTVSSSTDGIQVNVLPTVEQLYSRCNRVLEGLSNPIKTPVGTVSVPAIGHIHNMSAWGHNMSALGTGSGRSFVEFPNGVKEPRCLKIANDGFEAALAFHYQLNGDGAPIV